MKKLALLFLMSVSVQTWARHEDVCVRKVHSYLRGYEILFDDDVSCHQYSPQICGNMPYQVIVPLGRKAGVDDLYSFDFVLETDILGSYCNIKSVSGPNKFRLRSAQ